MQRTHLGHRPNSVFLGTGVQALGKHGFNPLQNRCPLLLIYGRETGAVDNTACRDFSGLDTLQASNVLRRLRDRGLLEKQGAGNRTYYVINGNMLEKTALAPDLFADEGGNLDAENGNLSSRSLPHLRPSMAEKLPSKGKGRRQSLIAAAL